MNKWVKSVIISPLIALIFLIALIGCSQPVQLPSETSSNANLISVQNSGNQFGLYEIVIDATDENNVNASIKYVLPEGVSSQSLADTQISTGLQTRVVSSEMFDVGTPLLGGRRHWNVTIDVRNADFSGRPYDSPRKNLTMVAVNTTASIDGTAFKDFRIENDSYIENAFAGLVARSITPQHSVKADGNRVKTISSKASLQFFSEADVIDIGKEDSRVNYALPYGFVVKSTLAEHDRILPANPDSDEYDGQVTLSFSKPLVTNEKEDVRKYVFNSFFVEDPITRVTEDVVEQSTGDVKARAAALNNASITVLSGSDLDKDPNNTVRCEVRTAGPKDSPLKQTRLNSTICDLSLFRTSPIGYFGGEVHLDNAIIVVPEGAIEGIALPSFTITRVPLEDMPSASAPFQNTSAYRFSSTYGKPFKKPIHLVIPTNAPLPGDGDSEVRELHVFENGELIKEQIANTIPAFVYPTQDLSSIVLVTSFSSKKEKIKDCEAKQGVFNGRYCQLPFPKENLVTQGASAYYKVLSINVGNSNLLFCGKYAVKLCSFTAEERVRKLIVQENPDIIGFQEVWHNDCLYVEEASRDDFYISGIKIPDPFADRVCFRESGITKSKQIDRLLNDDNGSSQYEWRCIPPERLSQSERTINGYECVAIRKTLFAFDGESSGHIQPSCTKNPNLNKYYKGRDTGMQVETVKLKNPIGDADAAVFDIVNVHMIGINDVSCRKKQLEALREKYFIRGINKPKKNKLLIMGDFNTDPSKPKVFDPEKYFSAIFADVYAKIDSFSSMKTAYLLSDPRNNTFGSLSLDHVLSNFAEGSCNVLAPVRGLDHKSLRCTLFGFDSGEAQGVVNLLDTSQPSAGFNRADATVVVSKRGVVLNYVRTVKPITGRHEIKGIPDAASVSVSFKVCPNGTEVKRQVSVSANQKVSLGEIRMADNLLSCF